jgi:hypothetical protein
LELPMKQNIITTPDQVSTLRVTMWPKLGVSMVPC